MTLCGTGAYAVTRIGEHLLGTPYLLANSGEFLYGIFILKIISKYKPVYSY